MDEDIKIGLKLTATAFENDVIKIDYQKMTTEDLQYLSGILDRMLDSFKVLQHKTTKAISNLDK